LYRWVDFKTANHLQNGGIIFCTKLPFGVIAIAIFLNHRKKKRWKKIKRFCHAKGPNELPFTMNERYSTLPRITTENSFAVSRAASFSLSAALAQKRWENPGRQQQNQSQWHDLLFGLLHVLLNGFNQFLGHGTPSPAIRIPAGLIALAFASLSIVTSSEPNGAAERKNKGAKQGEKPRTR